ncbi:MAG: hypothetical protein CMF12_04000 [Idiomarina sp.]|uniref:hypothetical protein n=1 Tax=Idiomarina sp. TaxID=1874361 RepID=UPI000C43D2DF|nr:hypothetical protein [Idiomarina sp.]MBT41666.1 hypothetical protein [Idiomarina sp.]
MNSDELNKLMAQLSEDAVVFAKNEYDIELVKEVTAIQQVDTIITALKERGSSSFKDKELFTLSNVLGAYVGEVVKNETGGEWLYDVSDEKAPAVRLLIERSDYPFASVVYQHLTSKPDVSVYEYARNALERHKK